MARKAKASAPRKAPLPTQPKAAEPKPAAASSAAAAAEDDTDEAPQRPRTFWSGNIAFGLVSVPVSLFVASRSSGASLRMVSADGTPLNRRYFCSREDRAVESEELVRGFEVEKDQFVVVEDDELAALAPEKSQEIDLRRFVDLAQVDPIYFERAYFLVPDRGASKAYRLLARIMEDTRRAGIATFVMRGKEYLVAIIAERGLLRAETLRFHDELRTPDDVGLPPLQQASAPRVRAMQQAIRALAADRLDRQSLADQYGRRLRELAEQKLASGADVIAAPDKDLVETEGAEVIDLMQVLKQSLEDPDASPPLRPGGGGTRGRRPADAERGERRPPRRAARARNEPHLESLPRSELYEQARDLDIPGRSSMTKAELVDAIRSAR